MRSTLTALPVGKGDAFLLERDDGTTILVDGGQARLAFPQQLSQCPGLDHIDVAVCTHANADHAEGILGLLEVLPVPVHEVWLPGRWTDRLLDLLRTPREFFVELAYNIRDAEPAELRRFIEPDTASPEERYAEAIDTRDRMPPGRPDRPSPEEGEASMGGSDMLRGESVDAICEALSDAEHVPDLWAGPAGYPLFPDRARLDIWLIAMRTADRIRRIARAAWDAGATIRWFDFEEASTHGPSGGGPYLYPLNAAEVTRIRMKKPGVFDLLSLTLANRESLVFISQPDSFGASVLFTADSDLATCDLTTRDCRSLLVTAPHHGAASNADAYAKVTGAYPDGAWWVRSDANYPKRPCQQYVDQANRACTLCRGAPKPKQKVSLVSVGEGWQCPPEVRRCECGPPSPSPHRAPRGRAR